VVPEGWVALGAVLSARGNKGEVLVELLTASPDRFREASPLEWLGANGKRRTLVVDDVWMHQKRVVLHFEGVDSISDAEALRGGDLCIPLARRREPNPGEVFLSDWIGMELVDEGGRSLGRIRDWYEQGELAWLEIEPGAQLVPYVREFFLSVDPGARRVIARLPEGLLE
jgi:16S rRNA processing protein RimM